MRIKVMLFYAIWFLTLEIDDQNINRNKVVCLPRFFVFIHFASVQYFKTIIL